MNPKELLADSLERRMENRRKQLERQECERIEKRVARWSKLYEQTKDKRYLALLAKYEDVDYSQYDYGVPQNNEI